MIGLSISKQCPWGKCNHSRKSLSVWQVFFMLEFTPSIRILRILVAVELGLLSAQCRVARSSVNTPELTSFSYSSNSNSDSSSSSSFVLLLSLLQIFVIFLSVLPCETPSSSLSAAAAAAVGPQIISNMFCRRCWIDFTTGEDYIVCSGPCAWPYHATCARVPRDLARELRRTSDASSSSNFASMEWYCRNCRQLYRLQLYFEVAITSAPRPRGHTRNRRTQLKDTFMRWNYS